MQDELRITFFVIGIVFIVGILLHGVWTIRKNKKLNQANSFQSGRAIEPRFDQQLRGKQSVYDTGADTDDVSTHEESYDEINQESHAENEIYDDVGVGKPRVISSSHTAPANTKQANTDDVEGDLNPEPEDISVETSNDASITESTLSNDLSDDIDSVKEDLSVDDDASISDTDKPSLLDKGVSEDLTDNASSTPVYSGVVTQPKPEFDKSNKIQDVHIVTEEEIPDPPGFLLKAAEGKSDDSNSEAAPNSDFSLDVQDGPIKQTPQTSEEPVAGVEKELSFAEQAKRFVTRRKKTVAEKIRKDAKVKAKKNQNDDQMRMDFEPSKPSVPEPSAEVNKQHYHTDSAHDKVNEKPQTGSLTPDQTDVLVLNVKANTDKPISGAALLPMLLTLGFKFGEHDIFHRHVNTNGKGPILFSLTNMFKPGVFDIDNLENFSTLGVSLFMMLPIEGDAQQVFNMMHNAARKISEEFECKILDGNKVLLSKQSLQQYADRIRTFERHQHSR